MMLFTATSECGAIIAWCLFNETWGFGGQTEFMKLINPAPPTFGNPLKIRRKKLSNKKAYKWIQAMWNLAKSLDPTRLIEDMSVVAWEHLQYYGHGDTDINSWHFYTSDYPIARRWISEVVDQTYTGSTFNYVPGFQQERQPLIASEYGGIAALDRRALAFEMGLGVATSTAILVSAVSQIPRALCRSSRRSPM